jgi:hypothetical protein
VAFKSEAPTSTQQALISTFQALAQLCIHPETKKPYIKSFKAGRQNSPEEWTKGLELVFVIEFEVRLSSSPLSSLPVDSLEGFRDRCDTDEQNIEDRDYYINEDPAHRDFGVCPIFLVAKQVLIVQNRIEGEFKVVNSVVIDFEVGKW